MKKNFIIILTILIILVAIAGYYVYNVRNLNNLATNFNKAYEENYNKEISATTMISIINKAIDDNEKNAVGKIENTIYYQENEENSIKIEIKFSEKYDKVPMENIANQGIESFIHAYQTAIFKCTKIEYHPKTNFVKYLYFEYTEG